MVIVGVAVVEPPDEQTSDPPAAEMELELDPPEGQVATAPTAETTPGVVRLFGSVIVTLFPTDASVCCVASRAS